MKQSEFIKKAKELGYTDEDIKEILENREQEKQAGIISLPYEEYLIVLPIID